MRSGLTTGQRLRRYAHAFCVSTSFLVPRPFPYLQGKSHENDVCHVCAIFCEMLTNFINANFNFLLQVSRIASRVLLTAWIFFVNLFVSNKVAKKN